MCKAFATVIRFISAILNLIIGFAFLGLGVVGILLFTNNQFLLKFVATTTEHFFEGIELDKANEMAEFIIKYEDHTPTIFITIGFVLAFICFLGFIATCCSCSKLLYIYAILLAVATVAQIVAIGIIVGVPKLYKAMIFRGFDHLLTVYDPTTKAGRGPVQLWDAVMNISGEPCCGMDGASDFLKSPMKDECPMYCCRSDDKCKIEDAMSLDPPVPGCRDRIGVYSTKYMKKVFIIDLIFIAAQLILLVLTCVALTCKTATPI